MSKYLTPVLVLAIAILAVALFIKGSEVLVAYQVLTTNQSATTLNITNIAPTMESVNCYNYNNALIGSMGSNPLALRGGTTARVVCNGTGNDKNGGGSINGTVSGSISGRIYETAAGATCSADSTKCYVNASCATLTRKNETAQYFECSYSVYYHADNTSQTSNWDGNLTVGDGTLYGSQEAVFDVDELLAVGVPGILAFGTAQPGDKLNVNKSHTVTNYGNVQIDMKLNGSTIGIDCPSGADVPVANIKYNCTDTANLYDGQGTPLTASAASNNCTTFNLAESATTASPPTATTKDTYWGVEVPLGVLGNCQGTIWFTAVLS